MSEPPIDFKDIVEKSQDAIYITKASLQENSGPEIVYVNNTYTQLSGLSARDLIGNNANLFQSTDIDDKTLARIREAFSQQQAVQVMFNRYNNLEEEYWIELSLQPLKNSLGEVTHFAAIERDISEQKLLEQMLDQFSKKDALTGLLNRRAFDEAMSREFQLFTRTQNAYSILLVDIDNFNAINEAHGRSSGDLVLKNLASIVEELFRSYDQVARTGKDQFCMLLRQTTLEHALNSAIRFRQTVQQKTFPIANDEINITVSIGVTDVLSDDTSYVDAIERADQAMIQAKNNGRDQVLIYKDN